MELDEELERVMQDTSASSWQRSFMKREQQIMMEEKAEENVIDADEWDGPLDVKEEKEEDDEEEPKTMTLAEVRKNDPDVYDRLRAKWKRESIVL